MSSLLPQTVYALAPGPGTSAVRKVEGYAIFVTFARKEDAESARPGIPVKKLSVAKILADPPPGIDALEVYDGETSWLYRWFETAIEMRLCEPFGGVPDEETMRADIARSREKFTAVHVAAAKALGGNE